MNGCLVEVHARENARVRAWKMSATWFGKEAGYNHADRAFHPGQC